ncbi:MAG: hypothetical protein K2P27_12250 [Lachnospiraceae bacterium]|nr:hypothetical protein [Lachnospiraceae bacterium]
MRKQIKAQLLGSAQYLVQTAETLEGILKGLSKEVAVDVLSQIQELVIQIGNTIEDSEGEGHETIPRLEQACELLYQLSCSLDQAESGNRMRIQNLKVIFMEVKKEIEEKIPVKLEILFVPYQVSMWDSLESVWMAAREEEQVESYVVPIPFYDVRPDNSLGALHYEGDKYPDYVPVTPYWQYSIEKRKPDIIFFHNPYDESNSVTRVPEQYYAKNMKLHTDLLVYIPYFVSEVGGPSDHQCYTHGVLFADRVVVQPESIYEKYCTIYTKVLKQHGLEDAFVPAEEKFLPLGSPKFDKLLNMQCKIEDLPVEWREKILKPDGSRKKIIFYNLSIVPLLRHGEQILKKIDHVFSFFREKTEEVVLLWRPHPLLINTINSMIPQMKKAYLQRVKEFKEEGWGIYDETPDSNLAMVLSDGYYGDASSLLTSYRETGKPILKQDYQILKLDEELEPKDKQQLQQEYECSLECFSKRVLKMNDQVEKQSDTGAIIWKIILAQLGK